MVYGLIVRLPYLLAAAPHLLFAPWLIWQAQHCLLSPASGPDLSLLEDLLLATTMACPHYHLCYPGQVREGA